MLLGMRGWRDESVNCWSISTALLAVHFVCCGFIIPAELITRKAKEPTARRPQTFHVPTLTAHAPYSRWEAHVEGGT